eukprot:TRINITY_DN8004_c0_g1_i1.p2 TRINITY_DN8004_c0_g1~~TRINITY_DN8004_c0_g1_i1.p2  ORF type:complete len:629 (-),score=152.11 TRINITY_DN8004_c0_g1_i1:1995-3881(-)
MYNEKRDELKRTLTGIAENIRYMCDKLHIADFWKEVIVCIVSDGRTKANNDTIDYLTEIGICSPALIDKGLAKYEDVSVHLFESTVKLQSNPTLNEYHLPMQLMFALKERNGGKLDSHWWYFAGFSAVLNPDYCFLLDVGTSPIPRSFYYMFRSLERDLNVAGVAGEIAPLSAFNLNPLVAAQGFEYKIASILDKTMESVFGYISVLPGAFSAYRYSALLGDPLRMYFHHLKTPLKDQEPFIANMYLAEDRVLCYELVAKKNCNYTLRYVKEAKACTDVPTDLTDLIKQRRRWLNGSLFALLYAMLGWGRLLAQSSHSLPRKLMFSLQFIYYVVMMLMQWFAVANVYLVFWVLINQYDSSVVWYETFKLIFGSFLVLQGILGLGNKPKRVSGIYFISTIVYGLFNYFILFVLFYQLFFGSSGISNNKMVIVSLAITFGSLIFISLVYGALFEILFAFLQYLFLSSMYLIIFPMYSICNIHDISWGTKDLNDSKIKASADLFIRGNLTSEQMKARLRYLKRQEDEESKTREMIETDFERFRSMVLVGWVFCNVVLIEVMTDYYLRFNYTVFKWYTIAIFILAAFSIGVRTFGSLIFLFQEVVLTRCGPTLEIPRYPSGPRQHYPEIKRQ